MLRKVLLLGVVLAGCVVSVFAQAKYCVKLPTCEELGYIFPYKEGRRSIRCPFDTSKVLYLDYCQAYGLSSKPSDEAGTYQECVEEKADGTKINTGYYRYTRCNTGYVYKSGVCELKVYEIGEVYYYNNQPIGVVFADDRTTVKMVALKDIDASGQEVSSATYFQWSTDASDSNCYYDVDDLPNIMDANTAIKDMDGKGNTQKILSYAKSNGYTAQAATATSKYAPSVCGTGSVCGAGAWYLPSAGELKTLYDNMNTMNNTLRGTTGSGIRATFYWSSTEYGGSYAWGMNFSGGYKGAPYKSNGGAIRPVLSLKPEGR